MAERLLKFFALSTCGPICSSTRQPFSNLAHHIVNTIPAGPERTVALRKLLEAKDAAVRAVAIPE
jgi:hypothetical protein